MKTPMQHGTYTVLETAYIADTEERFVAGEIEARIIPVRPDRTLKTRIRLLDRSGVFYISLIKPYRKGMDRTVRSQFWAAVDDAVTKQMPEAFIGPLVIDMTVLLASVEPRLSQVDRLRDEVTWDPRVCSGAPVLRGTRHRVHQIAELRRQGVTDAEFREEYELAAEQIESAVLYDRLHPRLGRPAAGARLIKNFVEHVPDHR
jgi:uncharacterized protein (DUF433 family)